jgi:hypothetical protein
MPVAPASQPVIWLVASIIVAIAAGSATWLALRRRFDDATFAHGPMGALGWSATALFHLLPPLLAIRYGVLSTRDLGLNGIDWQRTLSGGLMLSVLLAGGMLAGWLLYRRSLPQGEATSGLPRLLAIVRAPVDALLHQWHWAFYRAAAAAALALLPLRAPEWAPLGYAVDIIRGDPIYWGAWLGLAAIGIEWALNPFNRASFRRPHLRETVLRRAALAVATTGLFILTHNLWLCWSVHLVVELLAEASFPLPIQRVDDADR